jgi:hypothetical protein
MACYNIPTTSCISANGKFLPNVKDLFDNPCEVNNMRYMYSIYKHFDVNYYGDNDDENNNLEKVEKPAKEEMWARVSREW